MRLANSRAKVTLSASTCALRSMNGSPRFWLAEPRSEDDPWPGLGNCWSARTKPRGGGEYCAHVRSRHQPGLPATRIRAALRRCFVRAPSKGRRERIETYKFCVASHPRVNDNLRTHLRRLVFVEFGDSGCCELCPHGFAELICVESPLIGQAIRAAGHDALLMVDTVASLGCMPFQMDDWGVDVAMAGSQEGPDDAAGPELHGRRTPRARRAQTSRHALALLGLDLPRQRGALPQVLRHAAGALAVRTAQGARHDLRRRPGERLPAPSPARRGDAAAPSAHGPRDNRSRSISRSPRSAAIP